MRPLVRVVVATSALLGALGVATPAAAETTEQCLPPSTSTAPRPGWTKPPAPPSRPWPWPPPGTPPTAPTSTRGDSVLLADLGLPDLGLFGPDLTAHLETPSLVDLGLTGVQVEFGIRLNFKVSAVIALTKGEGHFRVTLTWKPREVTGRRGDRAEEV